MPLIVSPGPNEVRGARRGALASREGARRTLLVPDAPNKNYTIRHNTLIVNKRQTIRFALLQCYALYAAHWLPINLTPDQRESCNFSEFFRETLSKYDRR